MLHERLLHGFRLHSLPHVIDRGPRRHRTAPQTNPDLHLVHTLRGRGVLHVGDATYEATPQVVLALPMHVQCDWSKPDAGVWEMQNIHYAVTLADGVPLEARYDLPVSFRPRGMAAIHRSLRGACRRFGGGVFDRMAAAAALQGIIAGHWRAFGRPGPQQETRDAAVERFCALLAEHAGEPFDAGWLASQVGLSVSQMNRRFRAAVGLSPQTFWQQRRLALCKRTLAESEATLQQLAPQLGFSDVYYFCRWFRQHTGLTPGRFRRESRPTVY